MKDLKDAFILMRIPFSLFLMPVFWFALSSLEEYTFNIAVAVFLVIHLFLYPASNGYNSYFDRDENSIGGLKKPPKVTKSLFRLVIVFDLLALLIAAIISIYFAVMVLTYLLISKAYSYKNIRLKKHPVISTLVVIIFQGTFTFLMVQVGLSASESIILSPKNLSAALISSLFLAGSYPLTQIYQHSEDQERGDHTISIVLGKIGTFLFSGTFLLLATISLSYLYLKENQISRLIIFVLFGSPAFLFLLNWFFKVVKDESQADFQHTMAMNKLSSICMSAAFILMIILN